MDWISQLPECIVHHILSFLDSPVDLVRSSLLSKKWFTLTASFPILNFNIVKCTTPFGIPEYAFLKYVRYTTSRFCEQNVNAHTFKLVTWIQSPWELDLIERCVESVLKKGVQVLLIDIIDTHCSREAPPAYCLPEVLFSVLSLTSLSIRGCEWPSSLMNCDVKFKLLKFLHFDNVFINEEVINLFTTGCPLLEEFNVKNCRGFKRFCVYGLQNLQKVRIDYYSEVERIEIEAPNLCYLLLTDWDGSRAQCIKLASCEKLTTVSYSGYSLPNAKVISEFLSNFPFVENLFLKLPEDYNNLKLSSPSLRTIVLHSPCGLDEINLDIPNLLLFEKHANSYMPDPLARHSPELYARMECYPEDGVDTRWFQKLRQFFYKKNEFKVFKLYIQSPRFIRSCIDVKELKMIQSPPYELECVELELDFKQELEFYVAIVDAVLWCFRPRSLTLRSIFPSVDYKKLIYVVMFTYATIFKQEDESQTNIQMVLSSSSKVETHYNDLYSLLMALPRDRLNETITFIKEEVVQGEAE